MPGSAFCMFESFGVRLALWVGGLGDGSGGLGVVLLQHFGVDAVVASIGNGAC